MAGQLVRIINNGKKQLPLMFDGKKYLLDPDGGELMVPGEIAKHWIGDWDLKKDEDVHDEQIRLKKLHSGFPSEDFPLKVVKIPLVKRTTNADADANKKPKKVNEFVETPKEKEFEDLNELQNKEDDMRDVDGKERSTMDWGDRKTEEAAAEKEAITKKKAKSGRSKK